MYDPEIDKAILAAKTSNPREIADILNDRFGRHIDYGYIRQILDLPEHRQNLQQAKLKASAKLEDNLEIVEDVSSRLHRIVAGENEYPLELRLKASQQLLGWTKLAVEVSGIHDKAGGNVFVLQGNWGGKV